MNMKKNILPILTSLLFFMAADAQAEEVCSENPCCISNKNFYAKIFSGANFLQNTSLDGNDARYRVGYIIAGSLGYCWRYGLQLEVEYAYRRNGIKSIEFVTEGSSDHGHFQTSSYMANLLWDVPLSSWGCAFWNIQPFVGAGIGYDLQRMHSSNSLVIFNQKWKHFSWQVMAGLDYPIFRNTEITLEYKFHQGICHFYNHSVGVGLIYKFGM